MKTSILAAIATAMFIAGCSLAAEAPAMPQSAKEHEWLKKFAGEWDVETEIFMEPGKPPLKAKGTESARLLGGFWVIGENKGDMMGMPFTGVMTFGYDLDKKQYVGTWVDSNTSTMWSCTGSVDDSGKVLTLNTGGMCPIEGKICQFRDTIEFRSPDKRVMTGAKLGKDGQWETKMIVTASRKNNHMTQLRPQTQPPASHEHTH